MYKNTCDIIYVYHLKGHQQQGKLDIPKIPEYTSPINFLSLSCKNLSFSKRRF